MHSACSYALIYQGAAENIELGTVKQHVHNILGKLGVRTRKPAAIIARQALANATISIKM